MIYILESRPPFHHAKFYLGYVDDGESLTRRLEQHRKGQGARICAAAVAQGHQLLPVATLKGDRHRERALKRMKSIPEIVRRIRAGRWNMKEVIVCLS